MYQELKIEIETLEEIYRISEATSTKNFTMSKWRTKFHTDCGTSGCLIGNYCEAHPDDELYLHPTVNGCVPTLRCNNARVETAHGIDAIRAIAHRLGISTGVVQFLFVDHKETAFNDSKVRSAVNLTQKEALKRLRSTIEYFWRKQRLLATHSEVAQLPRKARRELLLASAL